MSSAQVQRARATKIEFENEFGWSLLTWARLDWRGSQGARRSCHWWRDPSDHNLQTSWQRDDISLAYVLRAFAILVAASLPVQILNWNPQLVLSGSARGNLKSQFSFCSFRGTTPTCHRSRNQTLIVRQPFYCFLNLSKVNTEHLYVFPLLLKITWRRWESNRNNCLAFPQILLECLSHSNITKIRTLTVFKRKPECLLTSPRNWP